LLNTRNFSINFFCHDEYLFHMRVDFPDKSGSSGERVSFHWWAFSLFCC
jgi:hypothetical protein